MRLLVAFVFIVACDETPDSEVVIAPEAPVITAAAVVPVAAADPEPEAVPDTAPEENAGDRGSDGDVNEGVLAAPLGDARVEIGERTDRSGILRLTRALGLPAPLHVHGRPFAVPESSQSITLISFLTDSGEVENMHSEVWLLERAAGELFRVATAHMPHVPVPSYNDIAVGAEGLSNVLSIKAQNIDDFDHDGALEYQVVVELTDEVVCGLGALTHRHAMIFNLPSLTMALDVQTMESATVTNFRSAILWGDTNEDGHPDVDLRIRNCIRWNEEGDFTCAQRRDTHLSFLWVEAEDRWVEATELQGRAPCGG